MCNLFSGKHKIKIKNYWFIKSYLFQDVHKNLHKIYIGLQRVVSPVNGIVETVTLNELIQNLVLLKSDPVIKDELDATYKLFLKDMRSKPYKPSKIAEQCILSLL